MGQLFAVEIIYRGVFQKTLAKNITRGIVLAAHNEGKTGYFLRPLFGDAPERNGIPAKSFAIVANDDQTLEAGMAQYEPKQVDVTVVLDDTLCKGLESWAWYGLQPVHRALKPGTHSDRSLSGKRAYPAGEHSPPGSSLISWESSKGLPVSPACGFTRTTTPTFASWASSPRRCRNWSA